MQAKQLLLIDSIGAFLKTFLLFFVVKNHLDFFGVKLTTANNLTTIAFAIFCFGLLGRFITNIRWNYLLLSLASLNFLYCFITFLVIYAIDATTTYGKRYSGGELLFILTPSYQEIKAAKKI